jgi:hypothetical protein
MELLIGVCYFIVCNPRQFNGLYRLHGMSVVRDLQLARRVHYLSGGHSVGWTRPKQQWTRARRNAAESHCTFLLSIFSSRVLRQGEGRTEIYVLARGQECGLEGDRGASRPRQTKISCLSSASYSLTGKLSGRITHWILSPPEYFRKLQTTSSSPLHSRWMKYSGF